MRGPPQSLQPQTIPATVPQQPVVPAVQNEEYHSAHRPAYPTAGDSYPAAAHHQPQGARPPVPQAPEAAQGYDKRYPRQPEPKGYPPQPPYRSEEASYFSKPPQHHNVDPVPRFFGAPPRNPAVSRPPPPGMTMPPGFPQPPKDGQGQNGLPTGRDGPPHVRPPFGATPNSQFRGPTGHPQARGSTEENHDMGGYQAPNQERYNGPVALQKQPPQHQEDQR